MKYPQSLYVVGKFVGVHPIKEVSADFHTQDFAIDTEEQFNNIKVFQATRTAVSDLFPELAKYKKGDLIKVSFNLRSNKTPTGKWFTNITAWKIQPYTEQDASDFTNPQPPQQGRVGTPTDPQYTEPLANRDTAPVDDLPF